MRILLVIPDLAPATGGPVTAVSGLAGALAARGHAVAIATTDFGLDAAPALNGVDLHVFPCLYARRRWSPRLWSFLRREVARYDLISVHTLWQFPTWAAGAACRAANVRYVVTPHGMLDAWSLAQRAWRKRLYLRLVDDATLSGAAGIQMTSEGEWLDSRPESRWNPSVYVVPWGVERAAWADLPDPTSFVDRFPELQGRRVVLFLGRLHPKKQPEVALRAFRAVCAADGDACLVLAGPGPPRYVAGLQRLTRELGIGDQVVFTGLLRARAVREAYRAASVFVLPSWQENYGFAVVEAMAAGCPVIVSDRVDLAPDVEKAGAGVVVPPTVEATAEALARLLGDASLRRAMGENGRRLVMERFTWDRVTVALLEVWDDILTSRRRCPAWRPAPAGAAETG